MAPVLDLDFTDDMRKVAIERYQVSNQVSGIYFCTLPGCENVQYSENNWLKHFVNFHQGVLKEIKAELKQEVTEANVVLTPTNFEQPDDFLLDDHVEELTKNDNGAPYLGKSKKARRARFDCDVVLAGKPKKAKHAKATAMSHHHANAIPTKPLFLKTCSGAISRTAKIPPPKPQTLWEERNVSHFPQRAKQDMTVPKPCMTYITDTSTTSSISYTHGCDLDFDWDAEAEFGSDSECGLRHESPSKTGTKSVQQALAEGYAVAQSEGKGQEQDLEMSTKTRDGQEYNPETLCSVLRGDNGGDATSTGVSGFKEYRSAKGKIRYIPTNEDPWW